MIRVYMGLIKTEEVQFDLEWENGDESPIDLTGFPVIYWNIWTKAYGHLATRESGLVVDDEIGLISMYLSVETMDHFRINSFGYHQLFVGDEESGEVIIEGGVFVHGG